MTPKDLRNIHTTGNSSRDALPCATIALYPSIFICWWRNLLFATSKFGLLAIRQHSVTRKYLFSYPQGDRSVLRKWKASTLITATTSVELCKPVSTDVTVKPDSVLANPIWSTIFDQFLKCQFAYFVVLAF